MKGDIRERFTIEYCRKMLEQGSESGRKYTDTEVEAAREYLINLATILTEHYQQSLQNGVDKNPYE